MVWCRHLSSFTTYLASKSFSMVSNRVMGSVSLSTCVKTGTTTAAIATIPPAINESEMVRSVGNISPSFSMTVAIALTNGAGKAETRVSQN